jgi:alpha-N-arabinofuranosidase
VFYPDQPGRDFITVRGFALRHAATPWAPPTAEQIGLIGTHWSKGWIIENNVVSHSTCSGISLGKHGDQFDNTSADTAEGYVKTIERAHAHPIAWTKENIGHHIVRNNTVSHCEQAGIVGSLGCSFSTVTGNTVHDIHVRRLFSGAEQAGIKFHGAIDTEISRNHIYRTTRGLWLDWMAQGTRVSQNLFHDNGSDDLFVEVNHGPFVVDNNLFLSSVSLADLSQGGTYAHNLFAGKIRNRAEQNRSTPFHPAHSTTVAGLTNIQGGDDRFFNNVFNGAAGLSGYNAAGFPLLTGGNVYFGGAQPCAKESDALVVAEPVTAPLLEEESGQVRLRFPMAAASAQAAARMVTTESLGRARIPNLPYENANGTPLKVDSDFFGKRRDSTPTPGPFENPGSGPIPLIEPSGKLINVQGAAGI